MQTTEELTVVTPADWVPGPPQGSWTYEDYAALSQDGQRYEIVNGVLVTAPSPTPVHQDTVGIYAHAGIAEYWIVNAQRQTVEVHGLENGEYRALGVFQGQHTLPSRIVPALPVPVEQFFA